MLTVSHIIAYPQADLWHIWVWLSVAHRLQEGAWMLLLQMVQRGRQDWDEAGYGPEKRDICLDPQNRSVCYETIHFRGSIMLNHIHLAIELSTLKRSMNCKWTGFHCQGCLPKDTRWCFPVVSWFIKPINIHWPSLIIDYRILELISTKKHRYYLP